MWSRNNKSSQTKETSHTKASPSQMAFSTHKNNNSYLEDSIEKYQSSVNQVILRSNISGNNWKFDKFLDNNELTNALKSRGLVTSMLKGIEKKEWSFGDHPKPE